MHVACIDALQCLGILSDGVDCSFLFCRRNRAFLSSLLPLDFVPAHHKSVVFSKTPKRFLFYL